MSWPFGQVEKIAWLEIYGKKDKVKVCDVATLVIKHLQCINCSIFHKVKATRQWN